MHIPGEDTEDGQPKNVVVEIENAAIEKPFLCGYKDKRNEMEYLDAFTQTGPYFDKWKYRRYRTRDTQTWEHKEKILVSSGVGIPGRVKLIEISAQYLEHCARAICAMLSGRHQCAVHLHTR